VVESEKYSTYIGQYMHFDEGRIYVGTGEPSVYCLDAETGEVIWMYAGKAWQLEVSGDYILIIRKWRGGIVCLRRETGEPVWELSGVTYNRVYDDIVLVEMYDDTGYEGFIDRATGELLWKGDIYGGFYTQGYTNGIFYFRTDGGKALVAFNMRSGKELWQYRCDTGMGRVNLFEQGICVQVKDSKDSTIHYIRTLVLLDFNGQVLWEHSCEDVMCGYTGALMEGDTLFFLMGSGFIGAIDAETGTQLWEIEIRGTKITDITLQDMVVYAADVRVIEKRLYICATDGMVYCIQVGSGEILWVVDTKSRLYTHEGRAPPYFFAVGNILLVYTEDGHICAISVD
jgi:outer membrane protein assembly factor BamB